MIEHEGHEESILERLAKGCQNENGALQKTVIIDKGPRNVCYATHNYEGQRKFCKCQGEFLRHKNTTYISCSYKKKEVKP